MTDNIFSDLDDDSTFIERLNQNEEVFKAMLDMPEEANESMVESRREELFAIIWEETDMTKQEVLENVKKREEEFIEEHGDSLPKWLLRAECQDILLKILHEKLEENLS